MLLRFRRLPMIGLEVDVYRELPVGISPVAGDAPRLRDNANSCSP